MNRSYISLSELTLPCGVPSLSEVALHELFPLASIVEGLEELIVLPPLKVVEEPPKIGEDVIG